MIVTEQGFDTDRLDADLARLLGDGGEILAEAAASSCALIEPVHLLAHLSKAGGAILRVEFLDARQVDPQEFVDLIYATTLDDCRTPGIPVLFEAQALSPASREMLEAFESKIQE